MRRGFKAQCEQISRRYRTELGVTLSEALSYRSLAERIGVEVWVPEDVPGLSEDHVEQLIDHGASEWSALSITDFGKTVIVINSSHSGRRLANDVCHELAHIILGHTKARLEVSDDGFLWLKSYSSEQEEEADWLAASLLLPRDGLLMQYRNTQDLARLAATFNVSVDLIRMRINRTGIAKQLESSKRKRRA